MKNEFKKHDTSTSVYKGFRRINYEYLVNIRFLYTYKDAV